MRLVPRATLALVSLIAAPALLPAQDAAFPLRIGPTGRHLVDQRGVPFLIHGDSPWSLTHNLTFEEAVRYMTARKSAGLQHADGVRARRLRCRREQELLPGPIRPPALRRRRHDAADRAVLGARRSRLQGGGEARVPAAGDARLPRRRQGRLRRPAEEGRPPALPRVRPLARQALPGARERALGPRRRPQPLGREGRGARAGPGDPRGGRAAPAHGPLGERHRGLRLLRRRGLARRQQLVHLRAGGVAHPGRSRRACRRGRRS